MKMTLARLTDSEVAAMLAEGVYIVDRDSARVTRNGRTILPYRKKDDPHRRLIRVYKDGRRRSMHLSKLVWMSVTLQPIPPEFEVHHRNRTVDDDS